MTEKVRAAYETIDSLQLQGNYAELNQILQYTVDAILNDCEKLTLELPVSEYAAIRREVG